MGAVMRELFRSVLNTCALKPSQYMKARESGASMSSIDLEDSVPPAEKETARRLALPFFAGQEDYGFVRALRINGIQTDDGMLDIAALRESGVRPDAILLPKVDSPSHILILESLLGERLSGVGIFPIIESPSGLCAVEEIARVSQRIWGLIFGAADFSSMIGSAQTWDNLVYARSRIVVAASSLEIPAIDAPCFDLQSEAAVWAEVERARTLGFRGKIAIHPRQVGILNQAFAQIAAKPSSRLAGRGGTRPF